MPIFVYNSLTRTKEEFIPLKPPKVNIYTCGVTVYDESHIGHARSLYIFEVIRRYLGFRGYKVNLVRNITDIDDKIINRAKELKIDWQELVNKYIARYNEDLLSLGIKKADCEPRATENIKDIIKHIQGLIDKGFAYESGGDVYFKVRKFVDYGKLSGQGIEQVEKGVRIEPSENKSDPLDFALWKKSKPDEPYWESQWSRGRPGWHIECSVMAQKFLKTNTLDIHAGGRDLIFPHHENEIAQSEALSGKPFVKYWMHHGLLTINGSKMSKSLGNFVTIKDFINRYHNAESLKLFFLSAHYSHPIDYTEEKIEETKNALERILILLKKPDKQRPKVKTKLLDKDILRIEEAKNEFIEAMDDDFNTPKALAAIFALVNLANKNMANLDFVYNVKAAIKELLDILGISLRQKKEPAIITDKEIKAKILERVKARKNNDYILADKIRKKLEEKAVILEDTKDGTTWRRKL